MSVFVDSRETSGGMTGPARFAGPTWLNHAAVSALFGATVARLCRAKRLLLLCVLFLLPSLILLLARSQGETGRPENADFFLMLNLLPNAIVPFSALLFSSGLIQDEVEEQTLTYLIVRPLPRWMIYVTKLLAAIAVTCVVAGVCTVINESVIHWGEADSGPLVARRAGILAGLYSMILCTYCAVFGFLGLVFRKSLPYGVIYIVVFEGLFANIDFVVRKATVMNSFRNLVLNLYEATESERHGMLRIWSIQGSGVPRVEESLATLGNSALVMIALGAAIFSLREFRMKTPEAT